MQELVEGALTHPLFGVIAGASFGVAALICMMFGPMVRLVGDAIGCFAIILFAAAGIGYLVQLIRPRPQLPSPRPLPALSALPYVRVTHLLSMGERAFYDPLLRAVGGRYTIFAKVRLADLVRVPGDMRGRLGWLRRVSQKHVDFVLCDRDELRPFLVIELDDRSHERADRVKRDRFVDDVLTAAGIPVHHVPCQAAYDVRGLAESVQSYAARAGFAR